MTGKGRGLKALTTAAVSLFFCGAMLMSGCSGGEDENERLTGDWRIVSITYDDGDNEKLPDDYYVVLSFKSSGEYITTDAQYVGDFWIEWSESAQYHITGSGFYVLEQYIGDDYTVETDTTRARYKINGNKLDMTRCSRDKDSKKEYCDEVELTKVKLADVRKSVGAVYTINPAIKGSWILKEEGDGWGSNEWLFLGDKYFDGAYKYIPDAEYSDGYWCTNGDKLILVDDEDYTVRVELEYSVSGSGKNKTLTINGDKWELDDDYL